MRVRDTRNSTPRPFLKWVGGKGQLLDVLLRRMSRAPWTGRYHEPFLGGGALFFALYRQGKLGAQPAALSDTNPNLLDAWWAVQDNVEELIVLLEQHKAAHNESYYYAMRDAVPATALERAARIIYLNKTCFNGLYRENSQGKFNVPMGRYVNPTICDGANLRAVAEALHDVEIRQDTFASILDRAAPGDFVYFDPPYHPLSETSSFRSYAKDGFTPKDQLHLRDVFIALGEKGVYAMLSNSSAPFIRKAYQQPGIRASLVDASRAVNSKAEKRGKIKELLADNFALAKQVNGLD